MGKKGNWISAIKKAFSPNKDKPTHVQLENKESREKKKWAFGNTKKPEINSFIPIYREPSSIEKILGDSERDIDEPYRIQSYQLPPNRRRSVEQERDRYRNVTNQASSNRRSIENERDSHYNNRVTQLASNIFDDDKDNEREMEQKDTHRVKLQRKTQIEMNLVHGAPKPQLASKWVHPPRPKISRSVARASALKIQTAFRGYLARRNYRALKGLIRLQVMMRGESIKYQTTNTLKCMQILVKVQSQIRSRRFEMLENRDYNALKINNNNNNKGSDNSIFGHWSTQNSRRGNESWNESVLTKEQIESRMRKKVDAVLKRERALAYAYSHQLLNATPASTSAVLADLHSGTNQWGWTPVDRQVPEEPNRYQQTSLKTQLKLPSQSQFESISSKPKLKPKLKPHFAIKDDDSLTSCPPFSVPNYMAQTVSAKAKIKIRAQEKQNEKKKFNLGESIKWGKGYFWKDSGQSEREVVGRKHRSTLSVGSGFSIDSAVSMPVVVGRRPFK